MGATVESIVDDLHKKDLKQATTDLRSLELSGHDFGSDAWKLDMAAINERVDLASLGFSSPSTLLGADAIGNLMTVPVDGSSLNHYKPDGSLYATTPGNWAVKQVADAIKSQVKEDSLSQLGPGDHHLSLVVDGQVRDYDVHVPKDYNAKTSEPMVVLLAGANPDSHGLMEGETKANEISDRDSDHFIAVYPHALKKNVEAPWFWPTKTQTMEAWNSLGGSISTYDPHYDDLNYLKAVEKDVTSKLSVIEGRRYVFGFSDGGAMGNKLLSQCDSDYAVLGSSHGTILTNQSDADKACKSKAALWAVVSDEGSWIPRTGGIGTFTSGMPNMKYSEPTEQFSKWAKANQCVGEPLSTVSTSQSVREYTPAQCNGADVKEIDRTWESSFWSTHGGNGQHAIDGPGKGGFPFNIGAKGEWDSFKSFWDFAKHFKKLPDGTIVHD